MQLRKTAFVLLLFLHVNHTWCLVTARQSIGVPWTPPDVSAPRKATGNCKLPQSLLAFWAVGSSARVQDLVKRNVAALQESLGNNVEVYLAHYDARKSDWLKANSSWYSHNIRYSYEGPGQKFQLLQRLMKHFDSSRYDWVWALDEDVDFTSTDLCKMFNLARASQALIALPSFVTVGDPKMDFGWEHQLPRPDCEYRYTGLVDVIFPMLRPSAMNVVLFECDGCIHENSTWGLSHVWCHFSARLMRHDRDKACAILDATPVTHMDFATLGVKYAADGSPRQKVQRSRAISSSFYQRGLADKHDVYKKHPDDYVVDDSASAASCVKRQVD